MIEAASNPMNAPKALDTPAHEWTPRTIASFGETDAEAALNLIQALTNEATQVDELIDRLQSYRRNIQHEIHSATRTALFHTKNPA